MTAVASVPTAILLIRLVPSALNIPGQSIAGIALSGFGMEDDLEKSRAVGFTEHLIKPINIDRLQATLREIAQKASNND